jgi:hypothetical protein
MSNPFLLLNPIWWRMYTFNNHPLVPRICYIWILKWLGIKRKYLYWWPMEYWMYPPNFIIQCSSLQKTMVFKCKARINLYKFVNGTFAPCYSCLWVQYHNESLKHHKHWFCFDDLNHCVGRMWKFVVVRPIVPIVWPIQEGTNLTQKEATTLEEAWFCFDCLHKNNTQSLFGFQSFGSSNSHLHAVSCHSLVRPFDASCWPTTNGGKKVKRPFVFKIT